MSHNYTFLYVTGKMLIRKIHKLTLKLITLINVSHADICGEIAAIMIYLTFGTGTFSSLFE